MSELTTVISHFPGRELSIRRLYASTPEFRSLCEDYVEAHCAFIRWQADKRKAEDYRRLLAEIEEEIEEELRRSSRTGH